MLLACTNHLNPAHSGKSVVWLTLDMLSIREYKGERDIASERFTSREACKYRRLMKKNRIMNGINAGMIHGTTRHTSTRDPASKSHRQ